MANRCAVLGLTVCMMLVLNSVHGFTLSERAPEKRLIFGNMIKGMGNLMTDMIKAPVHAMEGAIDIVTGHKHHNIVNIPVPAGLDILNGKIKEKPQNAEKPVAAKTECVDKFGFDCTAFMKDIGICRRDKKIAARYCAKSCHFC